MKLLGICFGHQIIAKALGGEVKASNKGWGVGVRKSILKNKKQWMAPELDQFSLLYSHQDQVSRLPKEAEQLFFSDFCEFEAYQVGDHILSIQGHPEFTKVYARDRMVSRKSKLGEKLFYQARKSLLQETDQQTIGKWIVNFFSFT
ncbi:MAG: GMP synthase [Bdellovibrionaceae bacterium]|nr:GMP synthase [Pseudobdellovibrionaceae bacterium]